MFSLSINGSNVSKWEKGTVLSTEYSINNYPLFKFAYDYIVYQEAFDIDVIKNAKKDYEEYKLYQSNEWQNDSDLKALFSYYTDTEDNIRKVIKNIERRLGDRNDISILVYGRLASYLISASNCIGVNIDVCKSLLIDNLSGRKDKVKLEYLLSEGIVQNDETAESEYQILKKEMNAVLTLSKKNVFKTYTVEELEFFAMRLIK